MSYFGSGGTIHGTTQWETGPIERGQWTKGKSCHDCGRPISNYATRCMKCRRMGEETCKRNRKKFAARAAETTHEEKVTKAREQAVRFAALRDVRMEAHKE